MSVKSNPIHSFILAILYSFFSLGGETTKKRGGRKWILPEKMFKIIKIKANDIIKSWWQSTDSPVCDSVFFYAAV